MEPVILAASSRGTETIELEDLRGHWPDPGRSLRGPVLLVGRDPEADLCLEDDSVAPIHCILLVLPEGVLIRAASSANRVQVNGEATAHARLHHGDRLSIGPYLFAVHFPEPAQLEDAWRIQVAAVAAQQTALAEVEIRLHERKQALDLQEKQLSALLEAKQQRLEEMLLQLRADREKLDADRLNLTQTQRDSDARDRELRSQLQLLQDERLRVTVLRRKLKHRWHRHWMAERRRMQARELAVRADRDKLEEREELLARRRARLHTECALVRGELNEERNAVEAYRRRLDSLEKDLHARETALLSRASELEQKEQAMHRHHQHWLATQVHREQELHGLEERIGNLRRKLPPPVAPIALPTPSYPLPTAFVPRPAVQRKPSPESFDQLEAELQDQRLSLLEQADHLAGVQAHFRVEHAALVEHLEQWERRLGAREQQLIARQLELVPVEERLREEARLQWQARVELQAARARLAVDESRWQSERVMVLRRFEAREGLVRRQREALIQLYRRWAGRFREEVSRMESDRATCEHVRRESSLAREHWLRRSEELDFRLRRLAERELALEQARITLAGQATQSRAAEAMVQRLERRLNRLGAAAEKALARERLALRSEAHRLESAQVQLYDRLSQAEQGRAGRLLEETAAELERVLAGCVGAGQQCEREVYQAIRQSYEQRLSALQDEVELMAMAMMEEEVPAALTVRAAA